MIKDILESFYNVDVSNIGITINRINDEAIIDNNDDYTKNEMFIKVLGKPYNYSLINEFKEAIYKKMFKDRHVKEKVVYHKIYKSKTIGIRLKAYKNSTDYTENLFKNNNDDISMINIQMGVLEKKKIELIENKKR